jgi:signal transduction histidine kinase/HAMP domain-containing protein/ActR/RegA family two-component response regulator
MRSKPMSARIGEKRPPSRGRRSASGSPAKNDGDASAEVEHLVEVLEAVKQGDFGVRLPYGKEGVLGHVGGLLNDIIGMNEHMMEELVRVGRVVGREGKMHERASVGPAKGAWAGAMSSVNQLISDLVAPTNEVARVITAVARGDLSQKMVLEIEGRPVRGEFLRIGTTVNEMVDQLSSFAAEVTRVAKEVGTEGKLGGQADVKGVSGTWKDLTDNVNGLAANLTAQVRNIAKVTTAVAKGDLSQKITVDAKGEIYELKNTINTMVDTLNSFAAEVTRVAKEVGTEGKLGGQADVKGVSGTWKDLTDNVNGLAANLTAQVRNIAKVTTAVANGDLSQKITVDAKGEIYELKNTINIMVDQLNSFAAEVTRVAKEVGTEGKLGGQAKVKGVSGTWKDLTDNVNAMASNLTVQLRDVSKVATAIAGGDLTRKITVDVKGEILQIKDVINVMVDQLNSFAAEVTRVAKEVGTEGKLGGQAEVPGASGVWKDLTDNVNVMAANLTKQVRGIVKVVTAVADGDLNQKFLLEAKGEVAALAETINNMTDTLRTFADQVTTVAREVGVEGKLGGQANVPGARGTWRDLTDNVNQLAGNLTSQVRAIAEVSTAVAQGDLTRSISVEAEGEVAALKDNINQMIGNLKDTTHKNQEQDWLKTNLAKFSGMMQGQRSIASVAQLIMSELTPLVDAQHGAFFMMDAEPEPRLHLIATYGFGGSKTLASTYHLKENLIGQCAFDRKRILLADVPKGFISISSGMGEASPRTVVVLPVLFEGEIKAVIELASFRTFTPNYLTFLDQLMTSVGVILNMISSSMRTEELLQQLKTSNAELEAQATELNEKAKLLEVKNHEVELASRSLEEKAEQLQLISKYKSEFLANMSHELRTPLNSLLILSKSLAENRGRNLTDDQVRFAETVYSSGNDLLQLINEILDLSKVEAGKMPIDPRRFPLEEVRDCIEPAFRHIADQKGLSFAVRMHERLPATMYSDPTRLQQILKNLLSNAFKFTARGGVTMLVAPTAGHSGSVSFSVQDTGIGIPLDKHKLIFEAFQQADGTTSRKYGGTGLGLTISREMARLMGGAIDVKSAPNQGSTFTLHLPVNYAGADVTAREDSKTHEVAPEPHVPPLPPDAEFSGKKVLLVDDDSRNVFAISSVLKARDMEVLHAENGKLALELLQAHGDIDAVLMDTMMPEMDGLDATRAIRDLSRFSTLPIISLTAKAMKGDREKALAAGASEYVTKPVDPARLLAILHVWLNTPTPSAQAVVAGP